MKRLNWVLKLGILVALSVTATSASAALVSYKISNTSSSDLLIAVSLKIDGTAVTDYVGGIKLTKVSGDASMPSSYVSMCTDINGVLKNGGTYSFDKVDFTGLTGTAPKWGNPVSTGNAAQAIQNAAYIFANFKPSSTVSTDANRVAWAALQLATWEALYDSPGSGTFSLTSGRFQANGPKGSIQAQAVAQANTILASLSAHIPAPGTYSGSLLVPNPGIQGGVVPQALMFEPSLAAISPVPEPSTVFAGLMLLIPIGTVWLRSSRGTSKVRAA